MENNNKNLSDKKAVANKTVKKETSKTVCTNCEDSGMTCNTCGVGKVQE